MSRIDKVNYYLDIAETVLERSTCACEQVGALIVRNDEIIATGYNGAPRGRSNCIELGDCTRKQRNIPDGERYEVCRSVHAEANAIISAARRDCIGGTMYLVAKNADNGEISENKPPCPLCRKMMINAGLSQVVVRGSDGKYEIYNVQDWVFDDDSLMPKL